MCRLSWNLGASTSWNPLGLSRPVMGLLYLYLNWIILGASAKLRKASVSFVVSVCLCPSAWNNSTLTARIFIKFEIWVFFFFENLLGKFKFNPLNGELNPFCHLLALLGAHHILHVSRIRVNQNMTSITGALQEDLCTFMIISLWILCRMRNAANKSCRGNQKTHFMFINP